MIHLALYGRLPYMNSLFYPYIDPITRLPIIDPGIMAQLDPNTKNEADKKEKVIPIQHELEKEEKMNKEKDEQVNSVPIVENVPSKEVNEQIQSNNDVDINQSKIPNPINNYESFEQSIFLNSKTQAREVQYDLENYFNPLNYDLYFQSVYQMYPQLNDYYKKANTQSEIIGNSQNVPLVLLNTTLLDQNQGNNALDNCMIANMQNEKDEEDVRANPKKRNNNYKKH